MIRSSVRSAGLALLLAMSGCGTVISSGTGTRSPGLNVAEAALDGGAAQIALQVSDGVLRDSPNNVHALEIKGDALTLLGDYDQAGAIFLALLQKDPNSVRAGIGLGRVRLARNPAQAEQLFQRVLQHDPRNVTALNNLGIARDLQGHHAEAQPAYREALAMDPDLESAQVNLALSMAMNGQGPAAIKLLQAKATQPGAPSKVKHDYAVVLAMAGNRKGAERVLSEDMPPDEARQLLDSATGTRTKASAGNDAFASAQRDDDVPPDVVQVPEDGPGALRSSNPPQTMAAALAAPPPMVVRPRAADQLDFDAPMVQPVNPVAAAVTNQRPLALPMRATPANPAPIGQASATASDTAAVAPEVVAIPPTGRSQPTAPAHDAAANTQHSAMPETPSPQAILRPAPASPPPTAVAQTVAPIVPGATARGVPPAIAALPATQPVAPHKDVAATVMRSAMDEANRHSRPTAPAAGTTMLASAAIAPALVAPRIPATVSPHIPVTVSARIPATVRPHAAARLSSAGTETAPRRNAGGDEIAPVVQLAAAPSKEAAQSFWHVLVHRFPDALGQRQPVVVRFEHDGTVFWRVRAEGFDSLSEAQTLCAHMRAGGQACFVPAPEFQPYAWCAAPGDAESDRLVARAHWSQRGWACCLPCPSFLPMSQPRTATKAVAPSAIACSNPRNNLPSPRGN